MQELKLDELDKVSGGVIPLAVAVALHLAGNAGSIYAWYSFAKDNN